ncbi:hypothetical protein WJX73_006633 [Symbiochloris irregularis]|uniref:very-long-chain 3-oxoacyl-CoA synthase n=1 Tax=Symbiochloris irregularis TaxID=706552 RepID=A0AAW1PH51_9CHLO
MQGKCLHRLSSGPHLPGSLPCSTPLESASLRASTAGCFASAFVYQSCGTCRPSGGAMVKLFDHTVEIKPVPYALAAVCLLLAWYWWVQRRRRVLLLDFACYKPPEELKVTKPLFLAGLKDVKLFSQESLDFQERIFTRNGLSEATYCPPSLHAKPPTATMDSAREEARMVLFGAVSKVLQRTGLHPRDFSFLVVNCSLFGPTPSLSAMVINHFKMRSDILSYNLGGMGCSAGLISIGLAQRLLSGDPGKYALVISTENITQNWYRGDDRSMLIPNTLFRMGGAAIVLTNRPSERSRAKYELQHVVRVHLGADDAAYECVFQKEDEAGHIGVALNRDLTKVAGKALERNLTTLGPKVLPLREKLAYLANHIRRHLLRQRRLKPYIPDFKSAFQHFCLHAGGRGVIEGLGKQLALPDRLLEPSYASLFWYGNTSSASVWYALGFIESARSLACGDIVWQVGFGSGFKCNSAVWKALRPIKAAKHEAWAHVEKEGTQGMWDNLRQPALSKKANIDIAARGGIDHMGSVGATDEDSIKAAACP